MKQLLRIRQSRIPSLLITNSLDMENGHVEVVNIPPGFVGRGHDVHFLVVEGFALVQLDDGVFRGIAESTSGAGEEGDAGCLGEEGFCGKHGQ